MLCRITGHSEISYFTIKDVTKWRVLRNNCCWMCERWKYVVYYYDRRKSCKNLSKDLIGRNFMLKLNRVVGSWDLRRVSPKIVTPNFWEPDVVETEMCPSL